MTTAVEEAFTEELEAHATYQIVSGNPDTLSKKSKHIIDLSGPRGLGPLGSGGAMSHIVAICAIDLLSQEAIPTLKGYQADQQRWRASRVGERRAI